MRYVALGKTEVIVSQLCMGTVNYGTKISEEEAFRQMDRFVEVGGNFLDTARVYGDGISEQTIGKWLVASGNRDKIILCTKGGHPIMGDWANSRCDVENLKKDLAESLDALQTGYIDLYLMHRDNPKVPVAELIDWMEEQKQAGKIRHYGCSNWTLARIREAQAYAESKGYEGLVASEQMCSLAEVNAQMVAGADMHVLDDTDCQYHQETGMAMMAYMSIANGYLMKQVRGVEVGQFQKMVYDNEANRSMIEWLKANLSTDGANYTIEDICFHYIYSLPINAIALAAFRNEEQMEAALRSCEIEVPGSLIEQVARYKGKR